MLCVRSDAMKIEPTLSNLAILQELGGRIQHARLSRNLKQDDLAVSAGVSRSTIDRLEAGRSVQLDNIIRILRALDLLASLDGLLPQAVPGPLEQLRGRGKMRRRASGASPPLSSPGPWTWGDDR